MVVGQRDETLQEKNLRHIKEMKIDIEAWKNELNFARKKSDKTYEKYCITLIKICENTITNLEDFALKHFI